VTCCEKFEKFHSKRERKYPYYRIYVKNFVVYYVVIDDENGKIMEVRRFLYNRQDRDNIV
jgi:cytidylate kinase